MVIDTASHDAGRLLLRIVAGGFLLPHALAKLTGAFGGHGIAGFQAELQHFGLPAAPPVAWTLALLQCLLGLLIALGGFTRAAALLAAGFLATTVVLNVPNGWFWMGRGIEYPLLWAATALAVALFGPGRWSLDRALRGKAGVP